MNAATNTPRNRREAEAEVVARMMELLAESVAFDAAVWSATDRGPDMGTACLVELFEGNQPATTAPAAPVTIPDTSASNTPGPWRHARRYILTPAGHCVAQVFSGGADSLAEADANGRLIAAAPELLRCAVMALEELQEAARVNPLAPVAFRALRAAIAAATSASDTTTTEHPGA